jgi:uncharacterized protein YciI
MFIVLLKFADNRDRAGALLEGHKAWLKQGFDDGVFLAAGSLQPGLGGGILSHGATLSELQARVEADPFVAERVVAPEILQIDASMTDPRLEFLSA